jgi:hypothetical protein
VQQRTIVFGGISVAGPDLNDTWGWDGTVWTQLSSTGPSPRESPGLAFDSGRGVNVIFGGLDNVANTSRGDTWEGSLSGGFAVRPRRAK